MNLQTTNLTITSLSNYLILCYNKKFRKPLVKFKIKGFKNLTGRNSNGKILSYHRGGGHKRKYREINFNCSKTSTKIVLSIEYDPFRTAYIAAAYQFRNKKYIYILAPKNLQVGDILKSGINADLKLGHALPLKKIPIGSFIYNIASKTKENGKIARSAGTFAKLIEKNSNFGLIRMSSSQHKFLSINCYANLGVVSNQLHYLKTKQKAGKSRWLNKRPIVRGVAMNPIDHPHGGGEGKKSGLKLSPWGKPSSKKK
jgi:large subunit ribosomal protein L2